MDGEASGDLRSLARMVLSTTFDDLPEPVVENTTRRILDMVGCAIGGSGLEDVAALTGVLGESSETSGATALGTGRALPVHDAAMVNCIAGRSFDWGPLTLIVDDERVPSHITETSVLTALAVGEPRGISGEDLITAIVVGDDLAARVWLAAGDRPMPGAAEGPAGGFEQWGTVTTFAAAAIAAHLYELSVGEFERALGLALSMMTGAGHGLWDGATSFKLSQGGAARNGILAARLAAAGWSGVAAPLRGERGYYAVFETGCGAPDRLTVDLGDTFHVESCFKPYPGGRPTDAPIEAAIRLAREEHVDPADVEELVVRPRALASHYAKPFEVGPYPTGQALFSFEYAAASALVRGRADNTTYTPAAARDATVQELIDRTRLEPIDRDLDSWGAAVVARTADGRNHRAFVPVPRGDPPNPMSWDELVEKFRTQAAFAGAIPERDVDALVTRIEDVPAIEDVSEIGQLAAGEPSRA